MGIRYEYDDAVVRCFLKQQKKLFSEPVAESCEEAEAFLEDCMAAVVDGAREVADYFEEAGIDVEDPDRVLEEDEVFDVGDGRYLIVEG
ncbi:MAG: glyoxalase [Eubacteriales bacterium]|nr:glyoxalase [Eubacteriales bacterium]